jgi:hypothetical protein
LEINYTQNPVRGSVLKKKKKTAQQEILTAQTLKTKALH